MLHDSCYKYYKGSDCQETETQLSAKYCPTTAKQFSNVTALSLLDDSFSVFVFCPMYFKETFNLLEPIVVEHVVSYL